MIINGLNKLTLLDYPGLTACTIYTGGCNFLCPFCHNAPLVLDKGNQPVIPEKEVFDFLVRRKKVLDGVCITGGEPTLNNGLIGFITKLRELNYRVKLDTNGSNPEVLYYLIKNNMIDYVAMDIKNSLDKYGETVGLKNFDTAGIKESAKLLLSSKIEYEFRTTVVKEFHDEDSFKKIGSWLSGGKAYYLQQFVDSGNIIGSNLSSASIEQMNTFYEISKIFFNVCKIRGID